jgi:hypothetical protein
MAEAGFWYYPTGRPPVVPAPTVSAPPGVDAIEQAAALEQWPATP